MEKSQLANIIAIVITLAAFIVPVIGHFGAMPDGGDAEALAGLYGIYTLIPPLLALLLAFLTRNVILGSVPYFL